MSGERPVAGEEALAPFTFDCAMATPGANASTLTPMRETLPLLEQIPFPPIRRGRLDTLQLNVGYRCNQSCVHCHVDASPHRTEEMGADVADLALTFLDRRKLATLDITGGAPELNPH